MSRVQLCSRCGHWAGRACSGQVSSRSTLALSCVTKVSWSLYPLCWTLLSLCLVQIQARGATETLDNLVLLSIFHWGCYPTRGHVATTSRCFEIVSFNYGRTTFEKSFWKASFPCYIPRTAEEQFTK